MAVVSIILTPIPPVLLSMQPVPPVNILAIPTHVYGPFTPVIHVVDDWPPAPVEDEFYIKLNP